MPSLRALNGTLHAGHAVTHMAEMALPAAIVLIQAELPLSDLDLGLAIAVCAAAFGIGGLPGGWLVDHVGPRWPLVAFGIGAGASLMGLAACTTLPWFLVFAGLLGVSMSLYHPIGLSLLHSLNHRAGGLGGSFAQHSLSGNLAVALTPLTVGALGGAIGWRTLFVLMGIGFALYGLMVARIRWPAAARDSAPPSTDERSETGRAALDRPLLRLVLVLGATLFAGIAYRGLTSFLPKLFSEALGLAGEPARAGALATGAMALGLLGILLAGWLSDRGVPKTLVYAGACALQLAAMLPLVGATGPGVAPLIVIAVFAAFMTRPLAQLLAAEHAFPRRRSLSLGLYFLVSSGAGSSIGAALTGWASAEHGLLRASALNASLLAIAVVLTLALRRVTRFSAT